MATNVPAPPASTTPVPGLHADSDVVTTVLDAAGCGLTTADSPSRWTAHRVAPDPSDIEAGAVAEYHFDKTVEIIRFDGESDDIDTPDVHGADEITEEFIAGVRDVMNVNLNAPGHGWYAFPADSDDPRVIARIRFLWLTDEAAVDAGLWPW
ncbi:hypothetical protein ACGFNU_05755 [Spirillospora sp. NPDC048911]|uniref:hypothetical protein n=1 Tax=Spirillospora sp. NPDC048911 TaxID=3364527 RepID=UPI00371C3617